MTALDLVAALAVGYFLGGLPTAALVARLLRRDIFEVGSGNMGAMNTARHLGVLPGAAVFLVDVGKGAAAALLGERMAALAAVADPLPMALAGGVGAVVGHAWSPWVGFRGGKALATLFGALLPLAPVAALYGAALLVALVLLLRRPTLATVLALVLYPFATGAALLRAGRPTEDAFAVGTATALGALVSIAKHLRAVRRGPRGDGA